MLKKVFLLFFSVLYAFGVSAAQIVATVDDEIITSQDVQDRIDLMKKMFNVPEQKISEKNVLNALVDEKVQMITAQKAGISLTADEVKEHIAFLETQNQMPAGAFEQMIAEKGVSEDSLMSQLLSGLFWMRYMQQQDLKRPKVSKKEVDKQIKKFMQEFKEPGYLLAEIRIPFDGNPDAAEQLADSLFDRMFKGETFTDLALKYSKGKTADQMGDLGWVKPGEMEKEIDDVLPQMKPGQLSKPIKCKDSYVLLLMRDYQAPLDSDEQEVIQASQLVLPKDGYEKIMPSLKEASKSCMTFTQFAATHGVKDSRSGALPEMISSRMPLELKQVLEGKKMGELVGPIEMGPYALFVMKCGSRFISILPSREDIERELEAHKMEEIAEKALKDARKKLFVEIK